MRRAPTRFSSSPTLRLTVDFGIPRCLAAAVKLPVSATAAKTTIAFRSGPWLLIVLVLEQSFSDSYPSPVCRTILDLGHDTHQSEGRVMTRVPFVDRRY